MQHRISRWMPLGDNTNHAGEPIHQRMDFSIPPPATIGKIISAHSNVDLTKPHPSPAFNASAIAIFVLLAAIL
jgi:hypothetical protein